MQCMGRAWGGEGRLAPLPAALQTVTYSHSLHAPHTPHTTPARAGARRCTHAPATERFSSSDKSREEEAAVAAVVATAAGFPNKADLACWNWEGAPEPSSVGSVTEGRRPLASVGDTPSVRACQRDRASVHQERDKGAGNAGQGQGESAASREEPKQIFKSPRARRVRLSTGH